MSFTPATSKVTLSRGTWFHYERRRINQGSLRSITVNRILIDDCDSKVAGHIKHLVSSRIGKPVTELSLGSRTSVGNDGLVSVARLEVRSFLQVRFHARAGRTYENVGTIIPIVDVFGIITSVTPHDPRSRSAYNRL